MKKVFSIFLLSLSVFALHADEGMWLPLLLKGIEGDMQAAGFKLTAEDIYSVNKSSMKDAVCLFGGGCTAELISGEGLLLTNHHCGFEQIQSHSSVGNDYLSNGFWAKSRQEELTNPGLSVTFIIRMEDVTKQVLAGVNANMKEADRKATIAANISAVSAKTTKESYQNVMIRPFYYGNEYYLFVVETYNDVRMVGAPPQAIGNFGGDTDNWVWPRHTADFSVFRIYADKNGKPAEYSPDNVPFKPRSFFPVSLKGVEENDFTMVFGFPGRTQEYLSSYALSNLMRIEDPIRVGVREARLAVIKDEMRQNDTVRIKYASKYAGIANGWKKWKGEMKGLKKTDALSKKNTYEAEFTKFSAQDGKSYGNILQNLKSVYENSYNDLKTAQVSYYEIFSAFESVQLSRGMEAFLTSKDDVAINKYRIGAEEFFKDYDAKVDKKVMAALIPMYLKTVPEKQRPPIFKTLETQYKGDWNKYLDNYFATSVFTNQTRLTAALNKIEAEKIKKDPAFALMKSMMDWYVSTVEMPFKVNEAKIDSLNRAYMQAQREVMTKRVFYPDANSTLRLTYGKVEGFSPDDGVKYTFFTTLTGMAAKQESEPQNLDYKMDSRLQTFQAKKDYGQYAAKDGELHTCFLASNHTTGGNSGSPVINGNGELIGINFDRCWESTMSDVNYDVTQCRNITADIRYVLFVIDKYAGAGYLLNEMKIVK